MYQLAIVLCHETAFPAASGMAMQAMWWGRAGGGCGCGVIRRRGRPEVDMSVAGRRVGLGGCAVAGGKDGCKVELL